MSRATLLSHQVRNCDFAIPLLIFPGSIGSSRWGDRPWSMGATEFVCDLGLMSHERPEATRRSRVEQGKDCKAQFILDSMRGSEDLIAQPNDGTGTP